MSIRISDISDIGQNPQRISDISDIGQNPQRISDIDSLSLETLKNKSILIENVSLKYCDNWPSLILTSKNESNLLFFTKMDTLIQEQLLQNHKDYVERFVKKDNIYRWKLNLKSAEWNDGFPSDEDILKYSDDIRLQTKTKEDHQWYSTTVPHYSDRYIRIVYEDDINIYHENFDLKTCKTEFKGIGDYTEIYKLKDVPINICISYDNTYSHDMRQMHIKYPHWNIVFIEII